MTIGLKSEPASKVWRPETRWISNTAVLGLLAAIGYWGHTHHWQLKHVGDSNLAVKHVALLESPAGAELTSVADQSQNPRAPVAGKRGDGGSGTSESIQLRSANTARKLGIEVETVEERPVDEYACAPAIIAYDQTRIAQLSARVPGIVWRVDGQVGQSVKKGDLLAIIDAIEVGRAKSEFLQACVSDQVKTRTYQRLMSNETVISERQIREAEAAAREANFRQLSARQTLLNLGLPVTAVDEDGLSDVELTRRIQFLGLPDSVVQNLDPSTTTANLLPLLAPFDATIIQREIVTGEVVEPSHRQFVIADISRMWVQIDVRKEHAPQLRLGQEVLVQVDGIPEELRCELSWIGTEVDERTRTVQARAVIDNPVVQGSNPEQRLIRANAFGTAKIRIHSKPRAVVVPSDALQWEGASYLVFVPKADKMSFEARPVRCGIENRGYTEILDGLHPGEKVVTTGSHFLKSEIIRLRTASNSVSSSK